MKVTKHSAACVAIQISLDDALEIIVHEALAYVERECSLRGFGIPLIDEDALLKVLVERGLVLPDVMGELNLTDQARGVGPNLGGVQI